ncbi:vacuolar sorting-associated 37D, putative [Babesia caballi]|uniref:Vacuolar sorting-associated 37D, putative n=1 Tax=Babesia caballi TaxID=5871 RepID=A0AAV4M0U8_BABCB|nr:vacuolar sorting-associated 37D, putative [Babesia caballi]
MAEPSDVAAELRATMGALDRVMTRAEVEAMATVSSAYVGCSAESGPVMQYIGAGYYAKRAPLVVKGALERQLAKATADAAAEKQEPEAKEKTAPPPVRHSMRAQPCTTTQESDTIEIIERYDSSDE